MAASFQPPRASRMRWFGGPSVWLEFSPLAKLTSSINLGQGAPGWGSPPFVKKAIRKAAESNDYCQYAPSGGAPALISEIKRVYAPKLKPPIEIESKSDDPVEELQVLVTNGASQAISLACSALLSEGDEVILLEPAFDIYSGAIRVAGATPVYIPLKIRSEAGNNPTSSADLMLDMEDLAIRMSERTRMLILNSPHNPSGKVFTRDELLSIAHVLDKHAPNCVVLSDEVYEHLVYGDCVHVAFASVSQSAHNRTVSVYSAGKTFSATGLKIGWTLGPPRLLSELALLQQFVVFAVCHLGQIAIAEAMRTAENPYEGHSTYYSWLRDSYERKRGLLVNALRDAGMQPITPEGAFYVCARVPAQHPTRNTLGIPDDVRQLINAGRLQIDESTADRDDYNVCRNLAVKYGVASIPASAFFCDEHVGNVTLSQCVARFAFCHPDDVLLEAAQRLHIADHSQ